MASRTMHESGVMHHMPHGFTEEMMRDFIRVLFLALAEEDGAMDGMDDMHDMDDMYEPATEAMSPFVPLAWWAGYPWNPFFFPFFGPRRFHHRRPHHGGRPGGRPGGSHHGRPGRR